MDVSYKRKEIVFNESLYVIDARMKSSVLSVTKKGKTDEYHEVESLNTMG